MTITGPHGLDHRPKQFVFSEAAHQMYSDYAQFEYEPASDRMRSVNGSGRHSDRPHASHLSGLRTDLPRIAGLDRLTLRRKVHLRFKYLEDDRQKMSEIHSAGRFVYDFNEHLATFQEDVLVSRPTKRVGRQGLYDTLKVPLAGRLWFAKNCSNNRPSHLAPANTTLTPTPMRLRQPTPRLFGHEGSDFYG
ncbi:MAG: hypothetical protein R3B90_10120 [Planctomycetaceae bacterium]